MERSFSMPKGGFSLEKLITYTEEQVTQIKWLLNGVTTIGIQNAKQIAVIAQILDSGTPAEIKESEKPKKKEGEG